MLAVSLSPPRFTHEDRVIRGWCRGEAGLVSPDRTGGLHAARSPEDAVGSCGHRAPSRASGASVLTSICGHSRERSQVAGGGYGENAAAGGRQGLPSMRSCRTSMAFLPCLRAVSM
jgi:hypothetical protein